MQKKVKCLSLYDGMGCAYLALIGAGYEVEEYVAFFRVWFPKWKREGEQWKRLDVS